MNDKGPEWRSWGLVDLLRCEAPIEFDPATGWLTTMKERMGEDED